MTNEVRHGGQSYNDGRGGAALETVRRARRRLLKNNLLAQGVNAFTVALAAFILLLLLGAEILDWRWLVPIPLAAAGAGIFRAWRRVPPLYRTAQIVDRRMGLSDALSTAIFFHGDPERAGSSADMQSIQAERADSLARSVDVRRAIPYTCPRAAYAGVALFLLASSLLALRYGVTRRLDLKPPLAAILKLDMGWNQRIQAKSIPDPPPNQDSKNDDTQTASGDRATRRDPNQGAKDRNPSQTGEQSKNGRERGQEQSMANDAGEQRDQRQESASNEQQRAAGRQAGEQQSARDSAGEKQAAAGDHGRQNGDEQSSSLMDKFRDAVQNLIARMKPSQQQQRGGGQQQAEGDRGKSDSRQSGADQQQARNGGQNGKTQGQSRPGQGEADRAAEQAPAASKGQGGGADSASNSSKPSSGAGNEDGKKDIKQAEQLAAMGKISEILGKRSANLSGEATVEVQSTDQQLRTPYTERAAGQSSTGGEIGRDEVPLALQSYVEHYFEQVRKEKKK